LVGEWFYSESLGAEGSCGHLYNWLYLKIEDETVDRCVVDFDCEGAKLDVRAHGSPLKGTAFATRAGSARGVRRRDRDHVLWSMERAQADIPVALAAHKQDPDLSDESGRCRVSLGMMAGDRGISQPRFSIGERFTKRSP